MTASTLVGLECSSCSTPHRPDRLQNLCRRCSRPLLARYDLARAAVSLQPATLKDRPSTMWRYREVLPPAEEPVSLGEGFTPLRPARRLGEQMGLRRLYIKDEAANPTGSFKARGLSAAVTSARALGAKHLAIPTAGNAGLALAAYAAAAGLPAEVFCPEDTPVFFMEVMELLGARVHRVPGLITDCGARVQEGKDSHGWFDLSTLKEPYRVEGKKTMGYELAEQLGWVLPDVVLYPTGGGTGLVGMWKAFQEMESMGWIGSARPRMVSVQADGCQPIVRAFQTGAQEAEEWRGATTLASGLRVPRAVGDFLILQCLRQSGGTAVAVTDESMVEGSRQLGKTEGILAAPEGGATVMALGKLLEKGLVRQEETVVLFNTGTAMPYMESLRNKTLTSSADGA